MDLYAYAQISRFKQLAEEHNIIVPRLRGYRLMSEEEPIEQAEIDEMLKDAEVEAAERLCQARPFWSTKPNFWESSSETDRMYRYYLVVETDEKGYEKRTGVRWNRLSPDMRKTLEAAVEEKQQAIQKQFDTFNKYVGKNVLYIHSRMGGGNWEDYESKDALMAQPWFLERVDDCVDGTYCDFYTSLD